MGSRGLASCIMFVVLALCCSWLKGPMANTPTPGLFISPKEAARMLGWDVEFLYRQIRNGRFPPAKRINARGAHPRYWIHRKKLDEWCNDLNTAET